MNFLNRIHLISLLSIISIPYAFSTDIDSGVQPELPRLCPQFPVNQRRPIGNNETALDCCTWGFVTGRFVVYFGWDLPTCVGNMGCAPIYYTNREACGFNYSAPFEEGFKQGMEAARARMFNGP